MIRLLISSITIAILVTGFVSQILVLNNPTVSLTGVVVMLAHSCPSDHGTYTCGDTGHGCNNDKSGSSKKKDSNSKNDDNKSSRVNPSQKLLKVPIRIIQPQHYLNQPQEKELRFLGLLQE